MRSVAAFFENVGSTLSATNDPQRSLCKCDTWKSSHPFYVGHHRLSNGWCASKTWTFSHISATDAVGEVRFIGRCEFNEIIKTHSRPGRFTSRPIAYLSARCCDDSTLLGQYACMKVPIFVRIRPTICEHLTIRIANQCDAFNSGYSGTWIFKIPEQLKNRIPIWTRI